MCVYFCWSKFSHIINNVFLNAFELFGSLAVLKSCCDFVIMESWMFLLFRGFLSLAKAKKRRERLKWFFTVNGPNGPEERFMFRRDPCNDNRKQAIVNEMVKSIESKGLIADARGKCWLIDRVDNESCLG